MVLVSLERHKLKCAMRFDFKVTNNVTKYEVLLSGLRLAKKMQVERLVININSQLAVSQVNHNFSARDKRMAAYLKLVMEFVPAFEKFELAQMPPAKNDHADAISKLANNKDFELLIVISIEYLPRYSLPKGEEMMRVKNTPL